MTVDQQILATLEQIGGAVDRDELTYQLGKRHQLSQCAVKSATVRLRQAGAIELDQGRWRLVKAAAGD